MFGVLNYFFGQKDYNIPARSGEQLSAPQQEALKAWNLQLANFNSVRDALHNTLQSFKTTLDNVVLQEEVEGTNKEESAELLASNNTSVVASINGIKDSFAEFNCMTIFQEHIETWTLETDKVTEYFNNKIKPHIPQSNSKGIFTAKIDFTDLMYNINQGLKEIEDSYDEVTTFQNSSLLKLEKYLKEKLKEELSSIIQQLNDGTTTPKNAIIKAKNVISAMQNLAKLQRALDAIFVRNQLAKSATVHNADEVKEYNWELGRQMIAEFEHCQTHGENNVFPEPYTGPMLEVEVPYPSGGNQMEIARITHDFFYSMVCESFNLSENVTSNDYYRSYVQGFLYTKLARLCSSGHEHANFYDAHTKQVYKNLNEEESISQLKFTNVHYYINCIKTLTQSVINKYTFATVGCGVVLALGATFMYPKFDGSIDKVVVEGLNTMKQGLLNFIDYLVSKISNITAIYS